MYRHKPKDVPLVSPLSFSADGRRIRGLDWTDCCFSYLTTKPRANASLTGKVSALSPWFLASVVGGGDERAGERQ